MVSSRVCANPLNAISANVGIFPLKAALSTSRIGLNPSPSLLNRKGHSWFLVKTCLRYKTFNGCVVVLVLLEDRKKRTWWMMLYVLRWVGFISVYVCFCLCAIWCTYWFCVCLHHPYNPQPCVCSYVFACVCPLCLFMCFRVCIDSTVSSITLYHLCVIKLTVVLFYCSFCTTQCLLVRIWVYVCFWACALCVCACMQTNVWAHACMGV